MAKILLIDDEYSIRLTMSEMLNTDGHDVTAARDADEAWQLLKRDEYDIVVSDILMPGTNGLDLIRRIRTTYPLTQIIVISGEPNITTATQSVRIGAYDFLVKPVPGKVIRKVVGKAYNVRVLEQQKNQLNLEAQRYSDQLEYLVKQRTAKLQKLSNDLTREINRRKQIENQLQTNRELLTIIGDRLPEMIAIIDKNKKILYANRSFSKWFIKDDYTGKKLRNVMSKKNYLIIHDHLNKAIEGENISFKHDFVSDNGQQKSFQTSFKFYKNDHIEGVIILSSDIAD